MNYTKKMDVAEKIKTHVSDAEQEELRLFIQDIVEMGYEKFEELKPSIKGYAMKIMRFFTLPKTDLHKKYMEVLVEPGVKLGQKKESDRIKWLMKQGKSDFIDEHLVTEHQRIDVKYKTIERKSLRDARTGEIEDILHIAIPYFSSSLGRDRFGYGILVSNLKTPELFEKFIENIPRYDGNTELISNKK